jgi:hypothetical protein
MSGNLDPQLKPNLLPPQKCLNGCARWNNLAADGNTQNQTQVNAIWTNGVIPDDAGNLCAQPPGFPGEGPWCYCAGTNDGSWGYCQNRDNSASICKSKPNGLNDLYSTIAGCANNDEIKRNAKFASNTHKLDKDIENLRMVVQDTLIMGDSMFGSSGYGEIMTEVKARNAELKVKKETLLKDINKKESIIERSDRDFNDVRQGLPDTMPTSRLNFIEDYTVAILCMSYLFMLIAVIYVYTARSEHWVRGLFMSGIGSIFLSICLFIIFYLLA